MNALIRAFQNQIMVDEPFDHGEAFSTLDELDDEERDVFERNRWRQRARQMVSGLAEPGRGIPQGIKSNPGAALMDYLKWQTGMEGAHEQIGRRLGRAKDGVEEVGGPSAMERAFMESRSHQVRLR